MNTRKLLVSVLMLISVMLSACASATTPLAPTAVPPTVASTIAPTSALTTFSPQTFNPPITFSYGPDWKIDSEFSSQVVQLKYKDYDGEFLFIDPKSATVAGPAAPYSVIPFPDDFVNWIQAHGLFRVVKTQSVFVGGLSGTQIDAASACGSHTAWLFLGAGGWNCDPGGHYRFTYLDDVNGERLLIMTVGYVSAQDFALMIEASQKVLDTVAFSPPTAAADTTFSPKTFNLPMTLGHNPEWSVAEEYSDVFTLSYIGHDAGVSFINVKNAKIADGIAFPDDFVTWIQSPDSLFQVEDSKPVLVGGFKGIQINATFTCGNKTDWITLSGTGEGCANGERIGFIYLGDVHGERILIEIRPSPDGKDYEFIVEESQKVLDTVVFSKPTVFLPKTFNLITSVNFGSDWHVEEDYLHDLYLDNGQMPIVFNSVTAAQLVDPVGGNLMPFPDDFIAWIQSNPDFKTSEPTQVTVGGISGVQIDATPNTNISKKEFGLTWNILTSDGDWRFILLDNVNGEHVLIFMIAPTGKTFSELPELQQEIQHILDSVVFA